MRILIVDDEPDVSLLLGEALRARGHDIELAETGREALDKLASFHPDAALVDVSLPDIDGVTLAGRLRDTVPARSIRIVAFSGYIDPTLRGAPEKPVFDEFVLKPAALETIEKALRGVS